MGLRPHPRRQNATRFDWIFGHASPRDRPDGSLEGKGPMSTSTTRACPKCSTAISTSSKFCPSCGSSVSGVFSGGGTPLDGTAVLSAESVDTVLPILQDATS